MGVLHLTYELFLFVFERIYIEGSGEEAAKKQERCFGCLFKLKKEGTDLGVTDRRTDGRTNECITA